MSSSQSKDGALLKKLNKDTVHSKCMEAVYAFVKGALWSF